MFRSVTVADSKVSKVDGQNGRLIYRGYSIQDLSKGTTFEEVVYLLLMGRLPTRDELKAVEQTMRETRSLPKEVVAMLRARDRRADPLKGAGIVGHPQTDAAQRTVGAVEHQSQAVVLVDRDALAVGAHRDRQRKVDVGCRHEDP